MMGSRVVFDTNILVSALLWKGLPFRLLQEVEGGRQHLLGSLSILEELERVLQYPRIDFVILSNQTTVQALLNKAESLITLIGRAISFAVHRPVSAS